MNIERISGTFRALKNRNYRLFFAGQSISLIGTWMQQVAISWLIYRLTGSAFMLGVMGFCNQLPSLFLFPVSGILADRLDRRKLLIVTQGLALVQASILAVLVLSNKALIWHLLALSIFMGIINAFDMPGRQSFVVDMIDKREDLGNAIALNSTLFNAARLVGPTIAGAFISLVGEGQCFLINAVSYIAVIIALFRISVSVSYKHKSKDNPVSEIIEGTRYTFGFPPIRSIILFLAIVSFAGMPYIILMPVFAKTVLHGDAHTLGLLTGFAGLGAFMGALHLASRRSILGLGRIIAVAGGAFGVSLSIFSLSHTLSLSLLVLIAVGYTMMTMMASCNTVIQTIVKDSMRGRVMAFYNVAFFGIGPFGSLAIGSIAEKLGPTVAVFSGGCITFVGAMLFAFNLPKIRKLIRPIYIQKGILPAIASGMQNADSAAALQKD